MLQPENALAQALGACLRVLRGVKTSAITPRELLRAKRTLITRHETDLEDNNYWIGAFRPGSLLPGLPARLLRHRAEAAAAASRRCPFDPGCRRRD